MEREKSCCFTGHRPQNLPWGKHEEDLGCRKTREALALAIEYAYQDGYRFFYCGMARGIDLMAAELVLHSKQFHPDIMLIAAVPCPGQTKGWSMAEIQRYCDILEQCRSEHIQILSPSHTAQCMMERNRYMVDNSQRVIAVYNGNASGGTAYTISYALHQCLEIVMIDPNDPRLPERHTFL